MEGAPDSCESHTASHAFLLSWFTKYHVVTIHQSPLHSWEHHLNNAKWVWPGLTPLRWHHQKLRPGWSPSIRVVCPGQSRLETCCQPSSESKAWCVINMIFPPQIKAQPYTLLLSPLWLRRQGFNSGVLNRKKNVHCLENFMLFLKKQNTWGLIGIVESRPSVWL